MRADMKYVILTTKLHIKEVVAYVSFVLLSLTCIEIFKSARR